MRVNHSAAKSTVQPPQAPLDRRNDRKPNTGFMIVIEDRILLHPQDGKRVLVDPQEIYLLEAEGGETLGRVYSRVKRKLLPSGDHLRIKGLVHPLELWVFEMAFDTRHPCSLSSLGPRRSMSPRGP